MIYESFQVDYIRDFSNKNKDSEKCYKFKFKLKEDDLINQEFHAKIYYNKCNN
jgi:hypothetical protein